MTKMAPPTWKPAATSPTIIHVHPRRKRRRRGVGKLFTIADTYGVDIADGQDDVLILACSVVIERCQEEAARRR